MVRKQGKERYTRMLLAAWGRWGAGEEWKLATYYSASMKGSLMATTSMSLR